MSNYFISGGVPKTPTADTAYQSTFSPFNAFATLFKSTQNQPVVAATVAKIGQTLGAIFTPSFFPIAAGNLGFDYGVKAGTPIGVATGQTISNVIAEVKNLPNQIATGVQSFSINLVVIFIIIVLAITLFKKAIG